MVGHRTIINGIILLALRCSILSNVYRGFITVPVNEPAQDKTYNKTCVISEDSDQTAHPHNLIRVFANRMRLLQPQCYETGISSCGHGTKAVIQNHKSINE